MSEDMIRWVWHYKKQMWEMHVDNCNCTFWGKTMEECISQWKMKVTNE